MHKPHPFTISISYGPKTFIADEIQFHETMSNPC